MMRNIVTLILILGSALGASSQESKTYQPGKFTAVTFGVAGEVEIHPGPEYRVEVEGDARTLEDTRVYIKGNQLVITRKDRSSRQNRRRIFVRVVLPEFSGASLSGSGTISSAAPLKGTEVRLSVSGSGNIDLVLEAGRVESVIAGSGNIRLQGKSRETSITISGSGKYYGEELEAEEAVIRISGSGSVRVWASRQLDSRISGSGSVYYRGEPAKVSNHSTGSGSLRKL